MPFLGPTELKNILSQNNIITDGEGNTVYNEKRVEEAAYALSLGTEAYRTDSKDRKIEILDEKCRTIEINPGQFTLLMTDEYVCIPKNKLAFISIKAKQKLKGLINVSGFHVDPGFEGKLLFSVYNAGPSTITLESKKPYFLIFFADLASEASEDEAYNEEKNHHQGQKSIRLDYIDALKSGDLSSPNELLKQINEQKDSIGRIKWIAGIVITIAIGTAIKFWFDFNSYKTGVNDGMKIEQLDKDIDIKIKKIVDDSISLYIKDAIQTKELLKDGKQTSK